jgi:hypothetical protein
MLGLAAVMRTTGIGGRLSTVYGFVDGKPG